MLRLKVTSWQNRSEDCRRQFCWLKSWEIPPSAKINKRFVNSDESLKVPSFFEFILLFSLFRTIKSTYIIRAKSFTVRFLLRLHFAWSKETIFFSSCSSCVALHSRLKISFLFSSWKTFLNLYHNLSERIATVLMIYKARRRKWMKIFLSL